MEDPRRELLQQLDEELLLGARDEGAEFPDAASFLEFVRAQYSIVFDRHQQKMAQRILGYRKPGALIFAADGERTVGYRWVEAGPAPQVVTVGRHSSMDLALGHNDRLLSRHFLVLVQLQKKRPYLRVLDLATKMGFRGEDGEVLRGLGGSGPLIFRAAGYTFFVFPTGGGVMWNARAEQPWKTLPPTARRVRETQPALLFGIDPLQKRGEYLLGKLLLEDGPDAERLWVGEQALERGIFLGNFGRRLSKPRATDRLSRVHALLIFDGQDPFLLDAGSINGVFDGGVERKIVAVKPGATYLLGAVRFRWEPSS